MLNKMFFLTFSELLAGAHEVNTNSTNKQQGDYVNWLGEHEVN